MIISEYIGGADLFVYGEEVHKRCRKINKNGTLSKRVLDVNDGNDGNNNIYERLVCRECRREFWYDLDKHGRITRWNSFV